MSNDCKQELTDHEYKLLATYAVFSGVIGFLSGVGFIVVLALTVRAVHP